MTEREKERAAVDLEALADGILRAAGSALRHYTMPSTRAAILEATARAVQAGHHMKGTGDE